jgi:hypothetical protein
VCSLVEEDEGCEEEEWVSVLTRLGNLGLSLSGCLTDVFRRHGILLSMLDELRWLCALLDEGILRI